MDCPTELPSCPIPAAPCSAHTSHPAAFFGPYPRPASSPYGVCLRCYFLCALAHETRIPHSLQLNCCGSSTCETKAEFKNPHCCMYMSLYDQDHTKQSPGASTALWSFLNHIPEEGPHQCSALSSVACSCLTLASSTPLPEPTLQESGHISPSTSKFYLYAWCQED